jgi:hypothetical protein
MSSIRPTTKEEESGLLQFAQQAEHANDFFRDALWASVLETLAQFGWDSMPISDCLRRRHTKSRLLTHHNRRAALSLLRHLTLINAQIVIPFRQIST